MPAHLDLEVDGGGRVACPVDQVVIAGWSGRDRRAVEAYIDTRVAKGFRRPSRVPSFYRVSPALLTQAEQIDVLGADTSGEAEVVLIGTDAGLLVGIGSDHTDRAVAPHSVASAKQLCAKPVGRACWRFEEVAEHWDQIVLAAEIDEAGRRVPYQHGTLAEIMPPEALLADLARSERADLPPGTVLFCGTLPVIGSIRPQDAFRLVLHDPVRDRRLSHAYTINTLPMVD